MAKHYSTKEIAEVLLQILDGGASVLIDDADYIGQGIHKLYLDRDVIVHYAEREEN